jgi:phosphoglycolate phosphatase-like HAD superfamily hydrolase
MSKTIIFDFDGTLADTLGVLIEITNELAAEFGYLPVDEQQVVQLQGLSSREIIKTSGIARWQIPFLLRRFKLSFRQKAVTVQLFPAIPQMLKSLKFGGYKLGIVSSNSVENIYLVLQRYQLDHLFSFVHSCSIFGKSRAIKSVLRANYIAADEVIYVGDEIRDIEAAQRSKIPVISVTWGFNGAAILQKYQPDYLVNKPQEIIQLLVAAEMKNVDRS